MDYLKKSAALLILLLIAISTAAAQQQTTVVVRVKAKDAKLVGSSMGGALVKIKNAKTGQLLAHGRTKGSTGSTDKLVRTPQKRYEKLSTEGAAKFTANLNLRSPVFVTISAASTFRSQQEVTSTTQLWLIPGQDITGDGIILELPGFVVDIVDVNINKSQTGAKHIAVKTKVVMMCGCPTKPGGLWNSSKFKMKALLKQGDQVIQTVPLSYGGKTSFYEGSFEVNLSGDYKILVYAFDPRTENTGVDITKVHLN